MSRCLVTGSSGFIGTILVNKLIMDGHDVTTLSRTNSKRVKSISFDFRKDNISKDIFKNIDIVYHLFAIAHDTSGKKINNDLYQKLNTDVTIDLANIAEQSGVKKFIFISSVKAGGKSSIQKCGDEIEQNIPEGVYGLTKRKAELELIELHNKSKIDVVIIRPALVYGPGLKGNLKLMLSGIKKGWFPPLPEIGNSRSMIHVDDLVNAILMVAEDERANGRILIATDGLQYSSREIYNEMCKVLGKTIPKWSIPKEIFDMISVVIPRFKFKLDKLFGDEYYSSKDLESLGFRASKTLKEMNETDY